MWAVPGRIGARGPSRPPRRGGHRIGAEAPDPVPSRGTGVAGAGAFMAPAAGAAAGVEPGFADAAVADGGKVSGPFWPQPATVRANPNADSDVRTWDRVVRPAVGARRCPVDTLLGLSSQPIERF